MVKKAIFSHLMKILRPFLLLQPFFNPYARAFFL